jgi:hypothetical protein
MKRNKIDDIKRIGTEWNGIEWNKREGENSEENIPSRR